MLKQKKPIRIDYINKEDKKSAKLLEDLLNAQWEEYGEIVESIRSTRIYLE